MTNSEIILIIEPEDAIRVDLNEVLLLADYITCQAANYESGLQMAHAHAVDLVLMPYKIDGKTGEGLVANLRADPITASTRILVHGKYKDPQGWQPPLFLAAYYTAEEFLAAIRQALDTPLP